MIIAVLGNYGVGKTHWIRREIAQLPDKNAVVYLSPKTDKFPLDATILKSEFPDISIQQTASIEKLKDAGQNTTVYLEIPPYLEWKSVEEVLQKLQSKKVVLQYKGEESPWIAAADEVIVFDREFNLNPFDPLEIHRGLLTGEVLDYPSLETFWQELTGGAYGEILRVKGIFNVFTGECIYGEYLYPDFNPDFLSLNFPLCLQGRPTNFSGIEIIGKNLDKQTIADTLSEFCLSDEAIAYYQQQIRDNSQQEEEG